MIEGTSTSGLRYEFLSDDEEGCVVEVDGGGGRMELIAWDCTDWLAPIVF